MKENKKWKIRNWTWGDVKTNRNTINHNQASTRVKSFLQIGSIVLLSIPFIFWVGVCISAKQSEAQENWKLSRLFWAPQSLACPLNEKKHNKGLSHQEVSPFDFYFDRIWSVYFDCLLFIVKIICKKWNILRLVNPLQCTQLVLKGWIPEGPIAYLFPFM